MRADHAPDRSGAVGTLYVIGGGDPGLTPERWWRLAADLRARGVAHVDRLVLDDGRFDREWWHPSWGAVSSRVYHAPVASLGAGYGAFATGRNALDGEPRLALKDERRTGRARRPPRGHVACFSKVPNRFWKTSLLQHRKPSRNRL